MDGRPKEEINDDGDDDVIWEGMNGYILSIYYM
jgi:hypothetical protein